MSFKRQIWDRFCRKHSVPDQAVPLFKSNEESLVATFMHGKGEGRCLLRRSPEMEALVISEVGKVLEDHKAAPPPTPAREAPGNQSWKSNFLLWG